MPRLNDAAPRLAPILVTGPGGRVGAGLRRYWGDRYPLRLFDLQQLPPLGAHEDVIQGSIGDMAALTAAVEGCRAVVHLAATADEADFLQHLVPDNVVGLYNAFEAARLQGVRRFVFASTVQVLLGYPRDTFVRDTDPVWPVSRYACAKAFGGAMQSCGSCGVNHWSMEGGHRRAPAERATAPEMRPGGDGTKPEGA